MNEECRTALLVVFCCLRDPFCPEGRCASDECRLLLPTLFLQGGEVCCTLSLPLPTFHYFLSRLDKRIAGGLLKTTVIKKKKKKTTVIELSFTYNKILVHLSLTLF